MIDFLDNYVQFSKLEAALVVDFFVISFYFLIFYSSILSICSESIIWTFIIHPYLWKG